MGTVGKERPPELLRQGVRDKRGVMGPESLRQAEVASALDLELPGLPCLWGGNRWVGPSRDSKSGFLLWQLPLLMLPALLPRPAPPLELGTTFVCL